jgi:RHS repeat-associated protein
LMEGMGTNTPANDYTYNGKELNEDFTLNLYDYGARWYDASLGRWWSVDPMGEKYGAISAYHFSLGNPIRFMDFAGLAVINGHQEDRKNAQAAKEQASKAKAEFNGDKNSKEYKKLAKAERKAENKLASVEEKFQMVENILSDLQTYNPEEFNALNTLKDDSGTNVDVYIEVTQNLKDPITDRCEIEKKWREYCCNICKPSRIFQRSSCST